MTSTSCPTRHTGPRRCTRSDTPATLTHAPRTLSLSKGHVDKLNLLQPLEDRDVGLAAALAHDLEAVAAAGALELVEQGGHQAGAGGADRVAEGDAAAVDVDLLVRDVELLHPGEHDGREGLVALE